jgi:2-dehydro-3-deoxyglucarate aldolase/4-hydroxy-2-oxoheptanedioate aldolase
MGSPVIAELAGECGYDWLLLDLEHGCESEAALPAQLRALRGSASAAIVRVGAPHADLIARVLDWGAQGIMVPHVASAEEARLCVQAMVYPPHGKRGVSRSTRACGYGLRPPVDMAEPLLMAQIENMEGVERVAEIAEVEGVDVLFVGPADLQFDLKARPEMAKWSFEECLKRVVEAATAAGKQSGILVRDAADVQRHLDLGFTHIAIDSDLAILRKGWLSALANLKA